MKRIMFIFAIVLSLNVNAQTKDTTVTMTIKDEVTSVIYLPGQNVAEVNVKHATYIGNKEIVDMTRIESKKVKLTADEKKLFESLIEKAKK